MKNFMNRVSRGMSLVEITIVLTVLLVVFGAVFLFFSRGSEEFDFSRRQNELITIGRLALEEVTDIILYAGYMPTSGWDNDDWHPVILADSIEFEFYADYDANDVLDDTDYRNIMVFDQRFVVTDHGDYVRRIGSNISALDFNYLDELSNPLTEPLSATDLDLVRHIQINLTLVSEYRNTQYYTEVSTTISPRNLGINHNINPAFAPPAPLAGNVAFNVCGTDTIPSPSIDENLMMNMMIDWGLTVTPLTDDMMATFDFIGAEIDLIVLRFRGVTETFPHPNLFYNYTGVGDTLEVPVVTLNAQDGVDIFSMGLVASDQNEVIMTPANIWHPVNRFLSGGFNPFWVYNPASSGMQSILDSLTYTTPDDTVLTYAGNMIDTSGITVRNEESTHRIVHFSAHDASEYTSDDGWQIFYNVIKWSIGDSPDIIEIENFEDEDDYSFVDPGYGEDAYCYVVTPMISIPASTDANYEAILRFSHCYWTRNRAAGGYIEVIATDSAAIDSTWKQIPDEDLLVGYYLQQTTVDFPGGAGMDAYMFKSPGYSPVSPTLNLEEADLEDYRGKDIWIRWVFGVEDKASNNQDGWIVDDIEVLLVDSLLIDPDIRLDPWADSSQYLPRRWEHHEFPSYNDCWYYHDIYAIDPIFPPEQGYAWTTWGEIGYIGPWTHGGTNDSWEIGKVSVFTPMPDPDVVPVINGAHYSGNDLTIDDGLYNNYETSYLLSERYEVANTSTFVKIYIEIYRCLRLYTMDNAFIHLGFSVDTLPPDPMNLGLWKEVVDLTNKDHTIWDEEDWEVTDIFSNALADSAYENYWIIFTLITGESGVKGGWNVDNIKVTGSLI